MSPAPTVRELSAAVLNAQMGLHTDGRFVPGAAAAPGRKQYGEVIPQFLTSLRDAVASWQNKSIHAVTYEDIGAICVSLDKEFGTGRNAAVAPFWETQAKRFGPLFKPPFSRSDDDGFADLVSESANWIRRVIEVELGKPQSNTLGSYITAFFRQIVEPMGDWTIVTLNHDLWLERVLSSLGLEFHDGFETTGNVREFHPSRVREHTHNLLLKLHGSIDWRWHPDRKNHVKLSGGWDELDVVRAHHAPQVLIGTFNKLEEYSYGIFPYLFSAFDRVLSQATCLVVCGYGFGDSGVNLRLFSELQYRPELKMTVVHPYPLSLINSAPFHASSKLQPMFCSGRVGFIRCRFEEFSHSRNIARLHRLVA